MKNFIQAGSVLTVIATRAVTAGDLYAEGALVGFAQTDAEIGEAFSLVTDGVYAVSVLSGAAVVAGAVVYLKAQTLTSNSEAGVNPRAGVVIAGGASVAGSALCHVKINA